LIRFLLLQKTGVLQDADSKRNWNKAGGLSGSLQLLQSALLSPIFSFFEASAGSREILRTPSRPGR
jgi:hypothetical protein